MKYENAKDDTINCKHEMETFACKLNFTYVYIMVVVFRYYKIFSSVLPHSFPELHRKKSQLVALPYSKYNFSTLKEIAIMRAYNGHMYVCIGPVLGKLSI